MRIYNPRNDVHNRGLHHIGRWRHRGRWRRRHHAAATATLRDHHHSLIDDCARQRRRPTEGRRLCSYSCGGSVQTAYIARMLSRSARKAHARFLQRRGPQHAQFLFLRVMGWRACVEPRDRLRPSSHVPCCCKLPPLANLRTTRTRRKNVFHVRHSRLTLRPWRTLGRWRRRHHAAATGALRDHHHSPIDDWARQRRRPTEGRRLCSYSCGGSVQTAYIARMLSRSARKAHARFLQRRGPQHAQFLFLRVMGWRACVEPRDRLRPSSHVPCCCKLPPLANLSGPREPGGKTYFTYVTLV